VAGNTGVGGWIGRARLGLSWLIDRVVLDHVGEFAGGFAFAALLAIGTAIYHEAHHLEHPRVVIGFFTVLAGLLALALLAGGVRALRDAARRERYLEAQKELIYNALESVQQEIAMEEDWKLSELVQRGVLGPVRGLLMRGRFEDARLAVLIPTAQNPDEWTMRWAAGHSPEGVRNFRRNIDLMIAGRAYRKGELVICQDTRKDPKFEPNPRARRDFRSLVAMPLQVDEEVVGVLSVVHTEPNAFLDADVSFIRVIAGVLDVLLSAERDAAHWEAYAAEQRAKDDGAPEAQETP
jgi:hypothetical protein